MLQEHTKTPPIDDRTYTYQFCSCLAAVKAPETRTHIKKVDSRLITREERKSYWLSLCAITNYKNNKHKKNMHIISNIITNKANRKREREKIDICENI